MFQGIRICVHFLKAYVHGLFTRDAPFTHFPTRHTLFRNQMAYKFSYGVIWPIGFHTFTLSVEMTFFA